MTTIPSVPLARAGAILSIDLGAIVQNWRDMQARAQGAETAAVVKANAYGLGAETIATALATAGCKNFFVAHIDEGLALRAALPDVQIFILHGQLPGTEIECAKAGLIPVLSTMEQVDGWANASRMTNSNHPCALQIDTGMTRLGISLEAAQSLSADTALLSRLSPVLIMSHLACADNPNHPMNAQQITCFAKARALFPEVPASLAQSPGIFLGPQTHHDLVRPGLALYGGNPQPSQPNPMAQVVTVSAKIIQIQDVDSPQAVGYSATYTVPRKGRLATVSLGYADGFLRSIGNSDENIMIYGTVLNQYKVPLVGRISMDLITYDISDVPTDQVHVGDTIDAIGQFATIDDLATAGKTIPYEVLARLGPRFHRLYTNGSPK